MFPYILEIALPALSPAIPTSAHKELPADSNLSLTLSVRIQFRHHHIRRMTDNRTSNTGNITPQKTDPRLLQRRVRVLRLPERLVYLLDRLLKRRELDHRIRDLPRPERIQTLIQPTGPLLRDHLAPPFAEAMGVRRQCRLHPHLDGLERTQRHIREELGACGRREVHDGSVRGGEDLFAVQVLEHFVEPIFPSALQSVADECGTGAEEDALEALLGHDGAPGGEVGGIHLRVDLTPAFDLDEGSAARTKSDCWLRWVY